MLRGFNSILDDCLTAVRNGEPVEQVVARYPRLAARLRPSLTLAAKVQAAPRVVPRLQAQEQGWRLVRERAHQLRMGTRRVSVRRTNYAAVLKPAAAALGVILLMTSFGGGLAYASQDAMPDSPLYRVKLAGEDVRLWFIFDETHEAEILLDQSDQRVEEMRSMVSQGEKIPDDVLSALDDRNERAVAILTGKPEETALRARVLTQAQEQEDLLVELWPQVSDGARETYTTAVARLHNTRLSGGAGEAFVSVRPEDLLGGILSISGQAQQMEDGTWTIGGVEVKVDDRTIGGAELQAGATARFVVARSSNGRLQALSLVGGLLDSPDNDTSSALVSGQVESISSEGIYIGGAFIPFSSDTLQTDSIKPGQRVQVTLKNTANGVVASAVKPSGSTASSSAKSFTFEGTIEGDVSSSTNQWTIGGLEFEITPSTIVDASGGDARDGARVQVEAINNRGDLQASRVSVLAAEAPEETVTIIGIYEDFEDGVWIISGFPIIPPEIGDDPPAESLVSVEVRRQGSDLFAKSLFVVETTDDHHLVRTQGTISEIDGSRWTLEFGQVRVASTAEVTGGEPGVGQRALIWSEQGVDGELQARYARLLDDRSILDDGVDLVPTDE
ncbi:MAG: DUF5666 domain-containing protein [Dehalococcoidia bacterium]